MSTDEEGGSLLTLAKVADCTTLDDNCGTLLDEQMSLYEVAVKASVCLKGQGRADTSDFYSAQVLESFPHTKVKFMIQIEAEGRLDSKLLRIGEVPVARSGSRVKLGDGVMLSTHIKTKGKGERMAQINKRLWMSTKILMQLCPVFMVAVYRLREHKSAFCYSWGVSGPSAEIVSEVSFANLRNGSNLKNLFLL